MNIAAKIADRFNTQESLLEFEESSYFGLSRSCSVKVSGVWFDVWFDADYEISNVAESN